LSATHRTFLLGADPDGSGNLAQNQFYVSATVVIGGNPAANRWVRFTLTESTGDTVSTTSSTVQTTGSGVAVIGPILFTDGAPAGGTVFVFACVDQNLDSTCDGPANTLTLYFLSEPAAPLNVAVVSDCNESGQISDNCVPQVGPHPSGQPAGKDATLTLTLDGPASTGPQLPVVAVITDASPPTGTTANASFTTCPASGDGTDVQAKSTSFDGTHHTAQWDLYVCGIVNDNNDDSFTVAVYWDVDGNNAFTPGVDQQIGSTQTLTINDN
ncbi:MAG: hypothetical protein NZ761_02040, partial [Dehalococcoidia bacterium]|nr:hypothetical protein [Dehalococcoidia bacterium]